MARALRPLTLSIVWIVCLMTPSAFAQSPTGESQSAAPVVDAELGETRNVHQCGRLYLAGQFGIRDLSDIKSAGIRRVITLRTDGEIEWDEAGAVKEAGLEFIEVPFRSPDSLTDEVFDTVRELLSDQETATLFHCGSANRVGGVWLPFRVLDQNVDLDKALREAKEIGLRNEGYEARALDYIERKQAEREEGRRSRQEINRRFLDSEMDIQDFVDRFEIDNREAYALRMEILKAIQLKSDDRIADVGAGTGLYTRLFASHLDGDGWVFAVDIAPKFVEHVADSMLALQLNNVTSVLCDARSIDLPPESIDVAFVCDTYHHFEYPESSVQSIYQALEPGGQLVVVDFERVPGLSREWILGHVRAGKETVRQEIESVGFGFVEEVAIPGMEENYFLRFRKPKS